MTGRADGAGPLAVPASAWEGCSADTWRARWSVPELHLYRAIGSTNDAARRRAEGGAPVGTIVLADEQVAGRGRRGRGWIAPPGQAILMSCVFRPDRQDAATAPLRVGLAVARALEDATGIHCGIKWPNDLLIRGRKLAGILCEAGTTGARGWLVAGTGINVHQQHDDFPADIRDHATSVATAAGFAVDRAELASRVVAALLAIADGVSAPLDGDELDALRQRDTLRGLAIDVDGARAGTALGIAADGALEVRGGDGHIRTVRTGTVRISDQAHTETP